MKEAGLENRSRRRTSLHFQAARHLNGQLALLISARRAAKESSSQVITSQESGNTHIHWEQKQSKGRAVTTCKTLHNRHIIPHREVLQ